MVSIGMLQLSELMTAVALPLQLTESPTKEPSAFKITRSYPRIGELWKFGLFQIKFTLTLL
jgi:hypothetical protein